MGETKENNSNQNFAIVIFLGLIVLLVVVFLSSRGEDVGKLLQLLGGLFSGNLFSLGGFGSSLFGLLIAILIAAAWFGLGNLLTRFFEKDEDFNALSFARNCAFGAGLWALVWFFAGLINAYNKFTAIIALIIGLILAFYFALKDWRSLKTAKTSTTIFGKIAFGLILFTLLLTLVSALAPPTAKDALLYHIALPKQFVAHGNNQIVEGNMASFLALGAEMQNVWAMLLGDLFGARVGEAAVGAGAFMFAPLLLLAIYGWAREFEIGANWALLAALIIAAIPTFYHVASSVYVDLALTLFVTLAIHSIGKWWTDLQTKWLAFAALALGAALSTKLTTIFVIAALALIVLLRARQAQNDGEPENSNAGSIFVKGFGAFIVAALIASPWYLRTWVKTGSPIFPFYMNFWKGTATGWDAERSALFQAMNSNYGGASKGFFDYLLAPVKISLFAQPEIPQFYDGVLGVSFLLGLILIICITWSSLLIKIRYLMLTYFWAKYVIIVATVLIGIFLRKQFFDLPLDLKLITVGFLILSLLLINSAKRKKNDLPIELKIAVSVSGIVFLFWLFSSEQLRYLLPIVPGLAVATIISAKLISQKSATFQKAIFVGFTVTSLVGILTSVAWFAEKNPVRVVFGGESRDDYLSRRLEYYDYYKIINNDLPPDAYVWLINMRRDSYNLERAFFSDYIFENWTLKKMVEESRDINQLRQKAKQMGITHILTRHDFLLDYRRTDIVEEKRSEGENRAKLKMTEDFVLDKSNTIQADEKFSLIKLP